VTRLGEASDMLVGFAFKSAGFLEANSDGVRLLRGDNVQQGFIRWGDKTKKWPTAHSDELERYHLAEDDVILAMDRPIVGDGLKMAWITSADLPALLVQRVCRLRGKQGVALTNFIRYVLAAPAFSAHIHRITTGANIPHISGKDIAAYEFELPSFEDQSRIVACLMAYDDLIATNQRRIALLEDAARRLYREWFVHLRFPGHESVPMKDSLPDGWRLQKLSSIADVNARSIGSKEKPDSILYIDISSVTPGLIGEVTPYAFADAPGRARRRVKHGDVIWSCVRPNRRSHALIWEPDDRLVTSTGFAVLSAAQVPFSYLYFATTTDKFVGHLEQNATGAAYPAVTAKTFEDAEVVVPQPAVLDSFDGLVLPMFEQAEALKAQNYELTRARDLLLPKLMCGQLDVSGIPLPEEMAS
jgi:type I restriction enzyme S subunit